MSDNVKDVTVLLVEDDDVDAMTVKRSFEKLRIANPIVRARDGIEALEMLRSDTISSPYIILLDLQMPRMGGIEFLQQVREDPNLRSSIIFVITTSKDDEDILASYEKNIAGYFLKDSTGYKFLEVVDLLHGYWKIAQLPTVE